MTRIAPLMTLLAVGVLGGAVFWANTTQTPQPAPAAVSAAAAPAPAPESPRTEISLADVPVAGGPERTEVSLAEIPVAQAPAAPDPAGPTGTYAGRTAGRELTVAVAVNGGRAVAYVCDGARIETWMEGTAEGGTLSLKDKKGTASMTATTGAGGLEGTVTVDGVERAYSAPATDVDTAVANGRADVRDVAERAGLETP